MGKQQGFCVVAQLHKDLVIIKKVRTNTLITVKLSVPQEFKWTEKQTAKLIQTKEQANRLLLKIKDSMFEKLLTSLEIKKIKINKNTVAIIEE